jgi:hypothetical protein
MQGFERGAPVRMCHAEFLSQASLALHSLGWELTWYHSRPFLHMFRVGDLDRNCVRQTTNFGLGVLQVRQKYQDNQISSLNTYSLPLEQIAKA